MKNSRKYFVICFGISVFLLIICFSVWQFWPTTIIPSQIKKQLVSETFLPTKETTIIQKDSFNYDSNQKFLVYKALYKRITITFTETPSPDLYIDIPDAYQKFINGLNNYASFDTSNGIVYLTHPPKQENRQAAVMNAKGTLVFITADQELSNNDWRELFNHLYVVK